MVTFSFEMFLKGNLQNKINIGKSVGEKSCLLRLHMKRIQKGYRCELQSIFYLVLVLDQSKLKVLRVIRTTVQEGARLRESCYQVLWSDHPANTPSWKTPVLEIREILCGLQVVAITLVRPSMMTTESW